MPSDCTQCGTALVPGRLDCPACETLIHRDRLKALAASADTHDRAGRRDDAIATWRQMLELLPPKSRQHAAITERVGGAVTPRAVGGAATIGALALAASKIKTLIPTIISLGVSFAAYWGAYGWMFAAGLLASLWIHEMGHVVALRRCGIASSPPMFLPGIGAYVRLKQPIPEPRVDAFIGLAGPVFGALAALGCFALGRTVGGVWIGLGQAGAMLNLFNLTPFFQLDGARAFRALSRIERGAVTLAIGGAIAITGVTILWLPLIAAAIAVPRQAPAIGDSTTAVVFLVLIALLSSLAIA